MNYKLYLLFFTFSITVQPREGPFLWDLNEPASSSDNEQSQNIENRRNDEGRQHEPLQISGSEWIGRRGRSQIQRIKRQNLAPMTIKMKKTQSRKYILSDEQKERNKIRRKKVYATLDPEIKKARNQRTMELYNVRMKNMTPEQKREYLNRTNIREKKKLLKQKLNRTKEEEIRYKALRHAQYKRCYAKKKAKQNQEHKTS